MHHVGKEEKRCIHFQRRDVGKGVCNFQEGCCVAARGGIFVSSTVVMTGHGELLCKD